jgi:hypothetical protein
MMSNARLLVGRSGPPLHLLRARPAGAGADPARPRSGSCRNSSCATRSSWRPTGSRIWREDRHFAQHDQPLRPRPRACRFRRVPGGRGRDRACADRARREAGRAHGRPDPDRGAAEASLAAAAARASRRSADPATASNASAPWRGTSRTRATSGSWASASRRISRRFWRSGCSPTARGGERRAVRRHGGRGRAADVGGRGDVVIASTFPRYSSDVTELARAARAAGARIVALTDSVVSPLAARGRRPPPRARRPTRCCRPRPAARPRRDRGAGVGIPPLGPRASRTRGQARGRHGRLSRLADLTRSGGRRRPQEHSEQIARIVGVGEKVDLLEEAPFPRMRSRTKRSALKSSTAKPTPSKSVICRALTRAPERARR